MRHDGDLLPIAIGIEYVSPDLLWVTIRSEAAVSARIWLATVGRLTSAEKINSDTAIENTVKKVRFLLRVRFLRMSQVLQILHSRLFRIFQR